MVQTSADKPASSDHIDVEAADKGAAVWRRLFLLALLLLGFARAVILLDVKDLWWDESLSLQRAEESLPNLLLGVLVIKDGFSELPTIDQHPFFYFGLQALLIRAAGESVFVLRYGSALAAMLFTAGVYLWARWLERRTLAPAPTSLWAMALAAVNPFMLWYGQEARPYALWAALALLATYLLLRATEQARLSRLHLLAFLLVELLFLLTHYYAIFLIAIHLLILAAWSLHHRVRLGIIAVAVVALAGAVVGGYALWNAIRQGAGENFPKITARIIVPDLVNAFSLGPSADLAMAWPLDLLFAALAVIGAGWGLRSWESLRRGGWVLPVVLIAPVFLILTLSRFQPLYMNSRHLGMLVGPYTLLVGAGLAGIGRLRRWAPWLPALLLFAGIGWSTLSYHTLERYDKDDYTRLGEIMDGRIMPGDVVLYYPSSSWRIFEYYLPMAPVHEAIARGARLGVYGVPLLNRPMEDTFAWLAELGEQFDRIWVIKSSTHPYFDLEGDVERWLLEHFLRVRDVELFSQSSLRIHLYLPKIPVFEALPATVQHRVIAEFGELIRLAGYDVNVDPAAVGLPWQVRLYWQVLEKPDRRYRYIWRLVEEDASGAERTLAMVEREPYEGDIPTLYWDPGKTIMEFVEFPPSEPGAGEFRRFYTLQVYDAETWEKLPVTRIEGGKIGADGVTARFPAEAP
ncbi:MAG: glycosyltransferase family 39 protein [Caldilinea sp.]|nr:glycosyltransferase family 39 protein [Caldilinea sp.]MDW8441372.1 glycosyltransferase family 39 protein [Caldilineaceae bacterium]